MLLPLKSSWLRPHLMFCSEDGRTQELCLWLLRNVTIHRKVQNGTTLCGLFCSVDRNASALEAYTEKRKYFYSLLPADTENTTDINPATNIHATNTATTKCIP